MTDDHSTSANMEDAENIGLFSLDPGLESYKDHFRYRIRRYVDQKKLNDKHESSLEEFAQGNDGIVVKEFAGWDFVVGK
ncbi:hypothetical protein BUALT_Bualt07G0019200 [Buddleja alternifolia]|uniref:Uncharacterized protein n=1 Tax=Buddleja alternifolia TaxID=168488 RepID=A0AAV6XE49_9LAMI|nr:hypothetical protein BUALT_Bualt07G0019200 [Buddleja alternifolia]